MLPAVAVLRSARPGSVKESTAERGHEVCTFNGWGEAGELLVGQALKFTYRSKKRRLLAYLRTRLGVFFYADSLYQAVIDFQLVKAGLTSTVNRSLTAYH